MFSLFTLSIASNCLLFMSTPPPNKDMHEAVTMIRTEDGGHVDGEHTQSVEERGGRERWREREREREKERVQ